MTPSFPTYRLVVAAAVAAGGLSLLVSPRPASAVAPVSNGLIATSKCEDPSPCDNKHIWTVDPATGAEKAVTSDSTYRDYFPSFSPDGSRIVFQRCLSSNGLKCSIALVGASGGSVTYLTADTNDDGYPSFSPDGSKIVFSRSSLNTHIWVMDAGGGNQHELTSGSGLDYQAVWSPDSSTIAFERCSGGCRIYTVPAAGGSPVQLTVGTSDTSPSYSPDGSRIAFARQGASGVGIWTMNTSGGDQHELTSNSGSAYDQEPTYSPDGSQVAFTHVPQGEGGPEPLWVINADGSNEHGLTPIDEVQDQPDWQALHPATSVGSAAGGSSQVPPALGVNLAAPKKESIRKGKLYLFATSNRSATAIAKGGVAIPPIARSYRLRTTTKALSANNRTEIWLKIPKKPLRAIRAALARHERLRTNIVLSVKDGAGNATSKRIAIRLKK